MITLTQDEYDALPVSPPPSAIAVQVENGVVTIYETGDTLPPPPTGTLEQAREAKLEEIYQIAAQRLDSLTAQYSPVEVAGWREKEAEAIAYQTSQNPADCPELVAEAAESGINLSDLVATVLQNSASLRVANRAILAERTRLKGLVMAAQTVETVQAIAWG